MPTGCALPLVSPQHLLLNPQRVSNGLLVKNNALNVKNVRVGASPKRCPMAAKAIRNKVVRHGRDPSSAVRDNLERHPPVVLRRVAVKVGIRLHAEVVTPINNSNSHRRVNINRRHASDLSKVKRAATRVVLPAADAGLRVAKVALVRVALARVALARVALARVALARVVRHKAALAGSPVARRHRSEKHSAINASSD